MPPQPGQPPQMPGQPPAPQQLPKAMQASQNPPVDGGNKGGSLLSMILSFLAGAGLDDVTRNVKTLLGGGNKGLGPDPQRPHRPTGGPQGGGAAGAAAGPQQGPPPAPAAMQGAGGSIPPQALQALLAQLAQQRGQG